MKKIVSCLSMMVLPQAALADTACYALQAIYNSGDENDEIKVVADDKFLTKENWKTFDVVHRLEYEDCIDTMSQVLIEVRGQTFWEVKTTDDRCDGGNVYGVIYSPDKTTAIAHIYDGGLFCEADWRAEERSPIGR